MAILSFLVKFIGWPGVLLLAFYIAEEGIPGASRIPFLSSIPIIGDLTTGRVHSYAADQVKLATAKQTAICDGKLEKTVSTFQYEALAAQMAQEARLRTAAEQANTEASKRAAASQQAKETADAEIQRLSDEAKQNKKLSTPTKEDLQWLNSH
ncbi:MAG TPA: hypothetical protein VGC14_02745 [Rhizobium sp.]